MPKIKLILYREADGNIPLRAWLTALPAKVQVKCRGRLERLGDLGHELRRPEADLLRDGIHELRASYQGVHYRMLYFFHGNVAVVVTHGLTKEKAVPAREIELAIQRKARFERAPEKHTAEET